MLKIRWMALTALIGIIAVWGVWAGLNQTGPVAEPTATDATTPSNAQDDAAPAGNAGASAPPASSGGVTPPGPGALNVKLGRASYETGEEVPAYFVLKTVFEDYLAKPDRTEYDVFEIHVYVKKELTRYLAVGPVFRKDIALLPPEVKKQLTPWKKAKYTGDFEPYRLYELE